MCKTGVKSSMFIIWRLTPYKSKNRHLYIFIFLIKIFGTSFISMTWGHCVARVIVIVNYWEIIPDRLCTSPFCALPPLGAGFN